MAKLEMEIDFKALGEVLAEHDFVEVIRCKDCKHCITHEKILFCGYMGNIGDWRFRTETDFCSRGERKDEDNALV